MERIKSIVATVSVMIALIIHLHFVITMDVKNVRKIMKRKKNIGSTK